MSISSLQLGARYEKDGFLIGNSYLSPSYNRYYSTKSQKVKDYFAKKQKILEGNFLHRKILWLLNQGKCYNSFQRTKTRKGLTMSRVIKPRNKFVNSPKYNPEVYQPSKVMRIKGTVSHPENAHTLSDWLFSKYGISYKAYRNKSKKRREELRKEFEQDTGRKRQNNVMDFCIPFDV